MDQPLLRLPEAALRSALREFLAPKLSRSDLMVEELGLEKRATRIDLAIAADRLHGYEIKSDFDTLDRLAHQMHAYHRIFDTLTVVTTTHFVGEVDQLLPRWWGILVGERDDAGRIVLRVVREADANDRQEPHSLAALLWKDEALAFAHARSLAHSRATRPQLCDLIAEAVALDDLKSHVTKILRERPQLRDRDSRVKGVMGVVEPSAPDDGRWHLAAMS